MADIRHKQQEQQEQKEQDQYILPEKAEEHHNHRHDSKAKRHQQMDQAFMLKKSDLKEQISLQIPASLTIQWMF